MAQTFGQTYSGDILNHHTKMVKEGFKFDRIIADLPSFENRWPGSPGHGKIRDCVSAVAVLAERCIENDNGTVTVSGTGIAQEKWDEWVASQSTWELVPDSTWAMFRPYARNTVNNKHYWGRRDDWTFVRTYRKVGSDYTINRAAWPNITHHRGAFKNFPMPSSMNDVEVSAFREPIHKGRLEAKELQKWLSKNEISYETDTSNSGLPIVSVLGAGGGFTDGYVVQFSSDPADWYHIPKRISFMNDWYFNDAAVNAFSNNEFKGCRVLSGGNHKHVMLSAFILATHSNEGDHVLDPFATFGSTGAACAIMKRNYTGIEYNKTRKDIGQNAFDELMGVLGEAG